MISADMIDNGGMHPFKPWLAIGIRQRLPLPHLLDIRRRMEVISVGKLPAQFVGQATTNRRFSRSGYAHDQDNHYAPFLSINRDMTIK